MSKHHRVRTHHWHLGRLEVKDQIFETESAALVFANSVENAGSVKIFNHTGELTHTIVDTPAPTESYA
jgi:hypothetical protein